MQERPARRSLCLLSRYVGVRALRGSTAAQETLCWIPRLRAMALLMRCGGRAARGVPCSGGYILFGIYSNIVDAPSVRQLAGRPEALSDGYGPLRAAGRGSTAQDRQSTQAPAYIRVADRNVHN